MSEESAPFLNPPVARWRAHARDWNRRPMLVKQFMLFSAAAVITLPLLYMLSSRGDAALSIPEPYGGSHVQPFPPETVPEGEPAYLPSITAYPPYAGGDEHGSVATVLPPHIEDLSRPDRPGAPLETATRPQDVPAAAPSQPVTFALIMWSEHSASEGAILLKSIMMYTSVPVDVYILCDEEAQTYVERRLALVQRPRHPLRVFFYRMAWQAMLDRIEREGSISTVHAAGVPGLMKLFIHELLPAHVERAIFVDTDAFFVSDPALLWRQFDAFNATTAIMLPSHPEMFAPQWFDANKICSCVMLLDLARFRALRLMDSSAYRAAGLPALAPAAFRELFGAPEADTGRYAGAALGDQSFWWAIIRGRPELFMHLHYDWEVSSCLLDMYATGLTGSDAATIEDELAAQLHTWATPHQGEAIMPKLVHFNCLEGARYHEWAGWDDPTNSLAVRWAPAVRYHAGYKWLWLNQGQKGGAAVTTETVFDVRFADELHA